MRGAPMKFFSFWRSLASFRVRIALNLKNVAAISAAAPASVRWR
jgi:hypothetical protein